MVDPHISEWKSIGICAIDDLTETDKYCRLAVWMNEVQICEGLLLKPWYNNIAMLDYGDDKVFWPIHYRHFSTYV
jgi:hypothetical protein